jgi:hypothetical protein
VDTGSFKAIRKIGGTGRASCVGTRSSIWFGGHRQPSLAEIRNKQAHGDPFDGFPCGGLLELARDLIAYAYGDMIQLNREQT